MYINVKFGYYIFLTLIKLNYILLFPKKFLKLNVSVSNISLKMSNFILSIFNLIIIHPVLCKKNVEKDSMFAKKFNTIFDVL